MMGVEFRGTACLLACLLHQPEDAVRSHTFLWLSQPHTPNLTIPNPDCRIHPPQTPNPKPSLPDSLSGDRNSFQLRNASQSTFSTSEAPCPGSWPTGGGGWVLGASRRFRGGGGSGKEARGLEQHKPHVEARRSAPAPVAQVERRACRKSHRGHAWGRCGCRKCKTGGRGRGRGARAVFDRVAERAGAGGGACGRQCADLRGFYFGQTSATQFSGLACARVSTVARCVRGRKPQARNP
jgi:hypothetical protein